MTSPAVVNFENKTGAVELREFEKPSIGEDDVLLAVEAVSVCGSDLHQWQALHSWPVNYPVVLGHEFSGVIAETGSRVKDWSEGDRIGNWRQDFLEAANVIGTLERFRRMNSRACSGALAPALIAGTME